jgi:hypothetical protein
VCSLAGLSPPQNAPASRKVVNYLYLARHQFNLANYAHYLFFSTQAIEEKESIFYLQVLIKTAAA